MKKLKLLLAAVSLMVITSCGKDNDDILSTDAQVKELKLLLQDGNWKISNFVKNQEDLTAYYSDIVFSFENNNVLKAVSAGNEIPGTWRISNDTGNDVDSYFDVDFNLFFNDDSKLKELRNDYSVISANSEKINLEIGENPLGNTVSLSFSKN
ncbi:hypothetical protein C7S20_13805 [Christiangramia fulva]|uniref:DUF5004 domain-containing protein n=1 Tax=Christiangramia fulva TaxID=2126553 RepID=A0A2R3Z7K6_9FLAO|nr:hypothetical protein [Christiangramia fulva]AVR46249.1 hypothetical protein C7S20_13805 [Christiangramia fulva]